MPIRNLKAHFWTFANFALPGEASPVYLSEYDLWDRLPGNKGLEEPKYILAHIIQSLTPQARIIVILRNPVDRLVDINFLIS